MAIKLKKEKYNSDPNNNNDDYQLDHNYKMSELDRITEPLREKEKEKITQGR